MFCLSLSSMMGGSPQIDLTVQTANGRGSFLLLLFWCFAACIVGEARVGRHFDGRGTFVEEVFLLEIANNIMVILLHSCYYKCTLILPFIIYHCLFMFKVSDKRLSWTI